MTVLITARKVAVRSTLFNFEAIYQRYRSFIGARSMQSGFEVVEISRQTFLKLFLDMVRKGFLKSESQVDILSVNNKVSLGVSAINFDKAIEEMSLPQAMKNWAMSKHL